ncbi:hypothetical protein SDC9_152785 [bioreactor metagenome]|uniref:Uncharacterized protein n=1 Tax=bioreactor metagenome TaxID=1076179 RepID=A0A645EYP6_9ZZZZ
MSGITKAGAHPDAGCELPVVFDTSYLLQAFVCILQGIQGWRHGLFFEPLGNPLGIAFLDVSAIGQHHPEQINRRWRGVDGPLEPGAREFGQ